MQSLWWSLAGIATAFAPTLGLLMTFRALLGMGESFNWPCALRVTSGVLPPSDRSLENGIFKLGGAASGAVLTPLLVTPLAVRMGWRVPFVLLGLGGLIWVAAWLMLTRSGDLANAIPPRDRSTAMGLSSQATLGFTAVLILAIATTIAGWLLLPDAWRLAAVWWGVAVLMIGLLVASFMMPQVWLAGSEALVVALLCLAATGSAAYMVNYFAFGQDVAPSHTGLVIGYLGGLGNLFAAGFMPVAGWISQGRSGFTPNFIIIGLLPLAGLAALLAFWGQDDTKPAWTDR